MSIVITPQILGQQADNTLSYCFLNEPLKVVIRDTYPLITQFLADVTQIDARTGAVVETFSEYVIRDVASLGSVAVDLMKVVRQLHNFDTYSFSNVSDMTGVRGEDSVVSKYIYKFEIYNREYAPRKVILKLPIIGGRSFSNFVPAVDHLTPISEILNFDNAYLKTYTLPTFTLKDISSVSNSDYSPTSASTVLTLGKEPCEGRIIWKSKLGSWVSWGMNLKTSSLKSSYQGNLSTGMFESTDFLGGGDPYVSVNYTSVSSSNSISLKCLSLTAEELIGVSEISGSPAVYYQKSISSRLELMRLTASSAPIKTHINGGDFSVSLSDIYKQNHRVK